MRHVRGYGGSAARIASMLLAVGCTHTGGLPGAERADGEPAVFLPLHPTPLADAAHAEMRLLGATLTEPAALWLRVQHPDCPSIQFRASGDDTIIETMPGIVEVRVEAQGTCETEGQRESLLRVDLGSLPVAARGELSHVIGAHSSPLDERAESEGSPICVDIELSAR